MSLGLQHTSVLYFSTSYLKFFSGGVGHFCYQT